MTYTRFFTLATTMLALACADPGAAGPTRPSVPVASIELVAPPAQLTIGQSAHFTAITRSASGDPLRDRVIRWNSTRPSVAVADNSGRVAAISEGVTTIVATSEGRATEAELRVVPVTQAVARVVIAEGANLAMPPGSARQLHAEARSESGGVLEGRQQQWSSSNPGVVTVSAGGLVTAVAPGNARITVTVEGKSALLMIEVKPDVVAVEMDPASFGIAVNEVQQIAALPRGEAGHVINTPITWRSLDPNIATVGTTGRVRGVRPGGTWITATAQGVVGTALVIVGTWTEFQLTDVAGTPLPAPMFTSESRTVTYEVVSGTLRFLENTNRYEQTFSFLVHWEGRPSFGMRQTSTGRVDVDRLSGRRVLHPANGSPSFTVETIDQKLLVRQRYVESAPEVIFGYRR